MSTEINTFTIPLQPFSQSFQITLVGVEYNFTVKWNASLDEGWILDIDDSNNNSIVAGLPFITGTDILSGLEYLGFKGSLFVYTNGDINAIPTFDNLGTDSNLYFQTSVSNG